MAYIGFFIIMAGLAAAGGALDHGTSLATAIAMTAAGAALMWFFREEGESEDEKEDNGAVSRYGTHVDKHAGESAGGSGADQACGRGAGIPDADHGVSSRDGHRDRAASKTWDLCCTGGVGRQDCAGMETHGL